MSFSKMQNLSHAWSSAWSRAQSTRAWQSWVDFLSHDPLTLAASLAFYSALSFAPIIVLSMATASLLSPGAENRLIDQLGVLLGSQVRDIAMTVMSAANSNRGGSTTPNTLSLVTLIISATTSFAQLQAAINKVWGTSIAPTNALWLWLRRRLFSFGMLTAISFLLMTSLVASSAISLLLSRESGTWSVLIECITLVIFSAAFALLFRFIPNIRIPYRYTIVGGVFTAVLFELGKWALGVYLTTTASADAYGAASSLILLLIWVYYSSLIVLFGAGLTRYLAPPELLMSPAEPLADVDVNP